MEIVYRGVEPRKIVYDGTCSHCKTRVRFEQWEGIITYDQRDGDFISVTCPVCGRKIDAPL